MECLLRGRLSQDTAVARLNEENLGLINLPGWVCAATGAADHLTLHLSFLQPVKKKKKLWIFLFYFILCWVEFILKGRAAVQQWRVECLGSGLVSAEQNRSRGFSLFFFF